jgi:hypothetical protein
VLSVFHIFGKPRQELQGHLSGSDMAYVPCTVPYAASGKAACRVRFVSYSAISGFPGFGCWLFYLLSVFIAGHFLLVFFAFLDFYSSSVECMS